MQFRNIMNINGDYKIHQVTKGWHWSSVNYRLTSNSGVNQSLANWGPNLRFVIKAISNPLVPESGRRSILKKQNRAYMNPDF